MPLVWQRHPRYFISVAAVILTTIYLLNYYQSPVRPDLYDISIRDSGVSARLEQAERAYEKVVGDRKEMLRKFGPTPKDLSMYVELLSSTTSSERVSFRFPEDKYPWPAYTVCEC